MFYASEIPPPTPPEQNFEFLSSSSHYLIGRPLSCPPKFERAISSTDGLEPFRSGALVLATISKDALDQDSVATGVNHLQDIQERLHSEFGSFGDREVIYQKTRANWLGRYLTLGVVTPPEAKTGEILLLQSRVVSHTAEITRRRVIPTQTSGRFALIGVQTKPNMTSRQQKAIKHRICRAAPNHLTFGKITLLNPPE